MHICFQYIIGYFRIQGTHILSDNEDILVECSLVYVYVCVCVCARARARACVHGCMY